MFSALLAISILLLTSLFSWLTKNAERKAITACVGTSLGSLLGLIAVIFTLNNQQSTQFINTGIPNITFALGTDGLSSFFLIIIFGLSLLTAIYGLGYLKGQKRLAGSAPFFPLLVASMAAVTISRDGFSFIIFWEIMSLTSFFLVTAEHESKDVQNAGWIYLIATHLATAFLMAFFAILAKETGGSFLFKDFAANTHLTEPLASLLFVFALIGFGTKAGIFPLHVWLPHAHPAAPSYISALMSGVMIKTGIYGILRAFTFLGAPPIWWGGILLIVGILSAVLGIIYALMQNDLKRLLAYSSVENIGIITIGIGAGLIGISQKNNMVAMLGFAGALFHVFNHAIFKGLLFLGAGSVFHSTHTLILDQLGGLLKKLPATGAVFLIGALSICGLPPFNGFISEWLVYTGLFHGSMSFSGYSILAFIACIVAIAFAGGLAVACFTKVFGIIFLGEPRKADINYQGISKFMAVPMICLASLCIIFGCFPKLIMPALMPAIKTIQPANFANIDGTMSSLNSISRILIIMLAVMGALFLLRRLIFSKRSAIVPTWDCGYANPTAKMQYTASSFTEPIGAFFKGIIKPISHLPKLTGLFPASAVFDEQVKDLAEQRYFSPMFKGFEYALLFIKRRKKSTIQSYLMLIFVTLMILFVWEVWLGI